MRRLDFVIAGVQKGGTTALSYFLRHHPGLWLPQIKELHVFDDESINWANPDYTRLEAELAVAPAASLLGEATPISSFWPPAAERLARYNPRLKVIVLLRDAVARAYSHWVMQRSSGEETLPFSDAIRTGRSRMPRYVLGPELRSFSYVERGFYVPQIVRLQRYFPKENLLFLHHRDLQGRHETTLQTVCRFLGIAPFAQAPQQLHVMPTTKRPQAPLSEEDEVYLRELFRNDSMEARRLTSVRLPY